MNWRIDRLVGEDGSVVLRVSGRIKEDVVHTLQELIAREEGRVAVDLKDVILVASEAVRELTLIEADGVEFRNCPDYIREWVDRERHLGVEERRDREPESREDIDEL